MLKPNTEVNMKFLLIPAIHQPTQTQLCNLPSIRQVCIIPEMQQTKYTGSHLTRTNVMPSCHLSNASNLKHTRYYRERDIISTDQRMPTHIRQKQKYMTTHFSVHFMQAWYNVIRTYTNHPFQGQKLTKMAHRYEKSLHQSQGPWQTIKLSNAGDLIFLVTTLGC